MKRLERADQLDATLLDTMDNHQAQMWTALPGIIQSFDPVTMTCEVQPAIQASVTNQETNAQAWISIPKLVDCPIQFPAGGNCTLTFPVVKGDECLIIFASRCIDTWFQSGGYLNQQAIMRMHDLSDGFVLLGFRSLPRKIASISSNSVELRSDDAATKISLNPVAQTVIITAPGGATVNANVTVNGNLNVTGTVTATVDVIGNGTHLHTHVHAGVTTGSGNTGAPV